jgi:hypothetical protein
LDIKPDNNLLEIILEYVLWLGAGKNEILIFYNEANFLHKLPNV